MVSVNDLEKTNNEFFYKFCKEDISRPNWSNRWCFKDTLPNNDYKGCYAHLVNGEVVYIGLAIGNSFDGSGIGARVSKYWKKSVDYDSTNQIYTSTVEGITAIITLPFEPNNFYLAAALEVYLIQHLDLPRNKIHSKNK
jgi:hypothetical protein